MGLGEWRYGCCPAPLTLRRAERRLLKPAAGHWAGRSFVGRAKLVLGGGCTKFFGHFVRAGSKYPVARMAYGHSVRHTRKSGRQPQTAVARKHGKTNRTDVPRMGFLLYLCTKIGCTTGFKQVCSARVALFLHEYSEAPGTFASCPALDTPTQGCKRRTARLPRRKAAAAGRTGTSRLYLYRLS